MIFYFEIRLKIKSHHTSSYKKLLQKRIKHWNDHFIHSSKEEVIQ